MKFHVGIATRVAIFIALVIAGYYFYQQKNVSPQPPVIERTVQGIERNEIAPAPEFIIKHRKDLQLTDSQAETLTAFAETYRREIMPYQKQITARTALYKTKFDEMKNKKTSIEKLQTASTDLQHLSSIISTTRKAYYKKCYAVLTVKQQKIMDELLAKVTVGDLL